MQSSDDVETGNALEAQANAPSLELRDELEGLNTDAIAAKLDNASHEVVNAACWALASRSIEGKKFSQKIADKIKDPPTRYNAICALASLGVYHANAILGLSDPDVGNRSAAVAVLSGPGGDNAAADVGKLLKDSNPGTRCAACLALGGMRHQNSVSNVTALLNDKEEDSSWLAASMGGATGRPPAQLRKPRCAALLTMGMLSAMPPKVADFTTDSDWEARLCAVEALGSMGNAASDRAGQVASCLDDDTYPVRAKACETLGKLKAAQQVDRLADILNDKSASVRIEAIKAIAAMGFSGQQHLAQVAALLGDALNSVKAAAARALATMGDSAFAYASTIAAFLVNEDPFLRLAALEVLPQMGNYGSAFADDIALLLQDPESEVRAGAVGALGELNIASHLVGIRALTNDSDKLVAKAAQKAVASKDWGVLEERYDKE